MSKIIFVAAVALSFHADYLRAESPKSETWFNPATKRFEKVLVENSQNPAGGNKTEDWFNPVTKKFEKIIVENGASNGRNDNGSVNSDNGLPSGTANDWSELTTPQDSPEWKTYQNKITGQIVRFNPRKSYLWQNPATNKWEPAVREAPAMPQGPSPNMAGTGKPIQLGTLGSDGRKMSVEGSNPPGFGAGGSAVSHPVQPASAPTIHGNQK